MGCFIANFVAKQEYSTSLKDWTKPDTTSCSIKDSFENLKDIGILVAASGFNITPYMIVCLTRDLGNIERWKEIVVQMDCATLLTYTFNVHIGTLSTTCVCSNNDPLACTTTFYYALCYMWQKYCCFATLAFAFATLALVSDHL